MNRALHIGLIAQGGAGWAGGTEYIRNLLRAIPAEGVRTVSLICGESVRDEWQSALCEGQRLIAVPDRPQRSWLDRFRAPNVHFTSAITSAGIDFIYPLTYDNQYNVGVSLPLGAGLGDCRWAGWVPDFQHRHLPQLFSEKEIARRERGIATLVSEAPRIVFSSESAAGDFRVFFPRQEAKAEVLRFATFPQSEWYGAAPDDPILRALPARFLAVCNQFWKHKNHLLLFDALSILAQRGVHPTIVCTGQIADFRDPNFASVVLQTLFISGIEKQVLMLGLVPRIVQINILRRALAVIQPSRFEGWSTVVEDARALGKACLLSDIAVHREQDPTGARFFDVDDAEALAALIGEAWETLEPGPDAATEAAARNAATQRVRAVGERMLEIARRCIE